MLSIQITATLTCIARSTPQGRRVGTLHTPTHIQSTSMDHLWRDRKYWTAKKTHHTVPNKRVHRKHLTTPAGRRLWGISYSSLVEQVTRLLCSSAGDFCCWETSYPLHNPSKLDPLDCLTEMYHFLICCPCAAFTHTQTDPWASDSCHSLSMESLWSHSVHPTVQDWNKTTSAARLGELHQSWTSCRYAVTKPIGTISIKGKYVCT